MEEETKSNPIDLILDEIEEAIGNMDLSKSNDSIVDKLETPMIEVFMNKIKDSVVHNRQTETRPTYKRTKNKKSEQNNSEKESNQEDKQSEDKDDSEQSKETPLKSGNIPQDTKESIKKMMSEIFSSEMAEKVIFKIKIEQFIYQQLEKDFSLPECIDMVYEEFDIKEPIELNIAMKIPLTPKYKPETPNDQTLETDL